jgi:hypothetical protein
MAFGPGTEPQPVNPIPRELAQTFAEAFHICIDWTRPEEVTLRYDEKSFTLRDMCDLAAVYDGQLPDELYQRLSEESLRWLVEAPPTNSYKTAAPFLRRLIERQIESHRRKA